MKTQIASVVVLLLLVGGYTLPVTEQMSMGDVVLSPVTGAGTDQPMLAPGSGVVTLADGATIDLEQQELVRGYLDAYYCRRSRSMSRTCSGSVSFCHAVSSRLAGGFILQLQ